jgi:hypothetical protein
MTNEYKYEIDNCDVVDKACLHSFRQKRAQWGNWLEGDLDHAIWPAISGLVWRDTTFAAIGKLALENPEGPLNASLLGETIINGHVTMQVLALRRLVDRRKGVVSLHRLIKDVGSDWLLLTRENLVCFDGLPYDYAAAKMDVWADRGPGAYWGDTSGPKAYAASELLHLQFDRLSGIARSDRSRSDVLPKSLLAKVEGWLNNSGANEIVRWSHAYLAHAGNSRDRDAIAHLQVTNDKITAAICDVARVTEALSSEILGISGRMNALMPVAQYDVFERLEKPIASASQQAAAEGVWKNKSREWDAILSDVPGALDPASGFGRAGPFCVSGTARTTPTSPQKPRSRTP